MSLDLSRQQLSLNICILTLSDTRSKENDTSGQYLCDAVVQAGHTLTSYDILREDKPTLIHTLQTHIDNPDIDVVLCTGGTGLTLRDQTPEAFAEVVEKWIPGFGELFRWQSYQKIGTSTIQSRACAGMANGTLLFALPGSTSACKDAWKGILLAQLDIRHRPCNFAEILPRMKNSPLKRK